MNCGWHRAGARVRPGAAGDADRSGSHMQSLACGPGPLLAALRLRPGAGLEQCVRTGGPGCGDVDTPLGRPRLGWSEPCRLETPSTGKQDDMNSHGPEFESHLG